MDSDDQFWLSLWKYAITGFVVFVVACMGSCQMTNYQIRRAIDGGAAPLTARCALSGSDTVCDVLEAAEAEATRGE